MTYTVVKTAWALLGGLFGRIIWENPLWRPNNSCCGEDRLGSIGRIVWEDYWENPLWRPNDGASRVDELLAIVFRRERLAFALGGGLAFDLCLWLGR